MKKQDLNRPKISKKTESVIKKTSPNRKVPKQKSPEQDSFIGEFHQIFEGELIPFFLQLSQKTEEKGTHFGRSALTLKKRRLQVNIPDEYS